MKAVSLISGDMFRLLHREQFNLERVQSDIFVYLGRDSNLDWPHMVRSYGATSGRTFRLSNEAEVKRLGIGTLTIL